MFIKCDFHTHTTYSDGKLDPKNLIKLYKKEEISCFAITDHFIDKESVIKKIKNGENVKSIHKKEEIVNYVNNLWKIHKEEQNICLIPGYELTNNTKKFHVVVLNVNTEVILDPKEDLIENLEKAKENNFITIAAHPTKREKDDVWLSEYLWKNRKELKKYVDLWEVGNGDHIHNEVVTEKFKLIANSDFHDIDRLNSWRTKLEIDSLKLDDVLESIIKEERKSFYFHRPKI